MRTTKLIRFVRNRVVCVFIPGVAVFLIAIVLLAQPGDDPELRVMKMGLGSGTITSSPAGINCGTDCDENYGSSVTVTLTAAADPGSTFVGWDVDPDADPGTTPDCTGASLTCTVSMSVARSVRPVFDLTPAIPILSSFTPEGIQAYLTANPAVNSAARFIKALPSEYKQNWILMSRSESLQTGTAESPRILLPSADARFVFTIGMTQHSSYPGAHPDAIEYMQWDPGQKNFRFHEIVLNPIPQMDADSDGVGVIPPRPRGVSIDDEKCSKCHSTRNVLNLNRSVTPHVPGSTVGTDGIPPGTVKAKNKPNWDSYDSWGGMMPFNRDRIYQGSVEAAAFRKFFNPWTWRTNDSVRSIIEQLKLQPPCVPPAPCVPAAHVITRMNGGTNDGHINFSFDASPPVLTEPSPSGTAPAITTSYSFDGAAGTGPATSVTRGGSFITLHHSNIPTSDEGRGVRLFDALGSGTFNPQRIADELINHRFATGSIPIDVRPIALAILKLQPCVSVDAATNTVTSNPTIMNLAFFNARNSMSINDIVADTRARAQSLPRRKVDIQKRDLDRSVDPYLSGTPTPSPPVNGLIQQYGATTSAGTDTSLARLRQEVFRRPIDAGSADATVMGGIYVDRELYFINTLKIALLRYFLEPLGVSVDKWSMGVRGRSRTYTFADVFGSYQNVLEPQLKASLMSDPVPGLSNPDDCGQLITAVNSTLSSSSLPPADGPGAIPKYTDVQRIFNKSCIECHGGLDYPPYGNYGSVLNLSEDENPPAGKDRLDRSHALVSSIPFTTADPRTSFLYQRICPGASMLPDPNSPCGVLPPGSMDNENCPFGLMPCGGPRLSHADIATIRRWIVGGRPNTRGDPHIETMDGVNYDFQSAGEFVLLRGENLEIQARQTAVETDGPLGPNAHTGLSSCVSVNSAVAIRVGRHRITLQPNISGKPDPEGLQLRVDGKLVRLSAQGIPLEFGGRIIQTTAPGGIQIEAPGGTVAVITPGWWDYYQLWYLNIDVRNARATQGVMGAIAPRNWLPALPDGSFLGPRPPGLHQRYITLYDKFENAWRVNDATTLFDYAPGTSTSTFTIKSWPTENPQSCTLPRPPGGPAAKPPVKALPLEVAQQHCRAIVEDNAKTNCVLDVRLTGEPGFAQTYLRGEQIARNGVPTAPVLVFPEAFKTDVAIPVTFTWNKTSDREGDPLTYRHCVWEVNNRYSLNACDVVSIQTAWWRSGIFYAVLVALLGCLLLAVLIFMGMKKRPWFLGFVAIVIVAAVILAFYVGRTGSKTLARTVSGLEPGKAYYWKVVAEDGKGGTVESETRRFEIK